jgi:hypothetical protein
MGNAGGMATEERSWHGHNQSLLMTLPPLGAVLFKIKKPEEAVVVDTAVDDKVAVVNDNAGDEGEIKSGE